MPTTVYETEALLKDGSNIGLRSIKEQDDQLWLDFVSCLRPHTKYLHFQRFLSRTADGAAWACSIDYSNTFAIVAELMKADKRQIVGMVRCYRLPGRQSAEATLITKDNQDAIGAHL